VASGSVGRCGDYASAEEPRTATQMRSSGEAKAVCSVLGLGTADGRAGTRRPILVALLALRNVKSTGYPIFLLIYKTSNFYLPSTLKAVYFCTLGDLDSDFADVAPYQEG